MKFRNNIVLCLLVLVTLAGCASTKVADRQQLVSGQIARPNNIWVYDFVATPADVPSDSDISAQGTAQTAEQVDMGRQLGAQIARELVADIQGMGLPAQEGTPGSSPQIGDIVIRGYLVSIVQGSAAERLVIGFGAGASELTTAVEGFQVTPQGLRKLGSGTVESGGSKTPGAALPAAPSASREPDRGAPPTPASPSNLRPPTNLTWMWNGRTPSRPTIRSRCTSPTTLNQVSPSSTFCRSPSFKTHVA